MGRKELPCKPQLNSNDTGLRGARSIITYCASALPDVARTSRILLTLMKMIARIAIYNSNLKGYARLGIDIEFLSI